MQDANSATDFGALVSRIKSPALLALASHWRDVRANRRMPGWSDLVPSALAPHLHKLWAFKYDRQSGEFAARLAGTSVMLASGRSFRGTPLKEIHPPHIFKRAHANLTRIVTEPAAYRCAGPLFRIGDKLVEGERVVLPLAANGELADGVVAASDFKMPKVTGAIEILADKVEWFFV
jgi:hypothetical protein